MGKAPKQRAHFAATACHAAGCIATEPPVTFPRPLQLTTRLYARTPSRALLRQGPAEMARHCLLWRQQASRTRQRKHGKTGKKAHGKHNNTHGKENFRI
eukprot:scaffold13624_cov114-Isochrysis_galbana.AAC.1